MEKHGKVGRHPIWTEEELTTLREFWPDKTQLLQRLPRRNIKAIAVRARMLGLGVRRGKYYVWTDDDIRRLRKLFPRLSQQALVKEFPGSTWDGIKGQAQRHKIYRPAYRTKWLKTGQRILDEIRDRAKEFNYSVFDVLEMAGMPYKHKATFHRQRRPHPNELDAMVNALGGRIIIEWID